MEQQTAELLSRAAEELGLECEIYEGYSGRAMYGKTTWGLTVAKVTDVAAMAAQATITLFCETRELGEIETDADNLVRDLAKLRSDNLGRDMIVY